MTRLAFVAVALASLSLGAEKPRPVIAVAELANPAAPRALGASLTSAPDGTLWLTWIEPGADGVNALRHATLATGAAAWSAPRTIHAGRDLAANASDLPQLAIAAGGRTLALWSDGRGGAFSRASADGGATWTSVAPWVTDGQEVEMAALTTLADGRFLAAWLDNRGKKTGVKTQQLYARIVGDPAPDLLVDPAVCDCCPTALTAFPDGTALLAYRGRTAEEVRDIRITRLRGREWDESRPLNNDDWRIAGCPVNGPRLASDGGRVAVAWFTAAGHEPRVLASFSPDAGARFLMPLRVDLGKPAGHVDTVLLHDGALLVTWGETDGSVWLRRISPDFTAGEAVPLAPPGAISAPTVPRAALRRDYAGGKTTAEIVVAFARARAPAAALATLLVTVPEGELVEAEKNCDCAPTADELKGFSIRGTIAAVLPDATSLRVKHFELPGVFEAGTRDFQVAPALLAAVAPGRQFLGRVERRDGLWWLFDVRLIATPAK